jgi:hypothetical protein
MDACHRQAIAVHHRFTLRAIEIKNVDAGGAPSSHTD